VAKVAPVTELPNKIETKFQQLIPMFSRSSNPMELHGIPGILCDQTGSGKSKMGLKTGNTYISASTQDSKEISMAASCFGARNATGLMEKLCNQNWK
jgi:hypothetical protein